MVPGRRLNRCHLLVNDSVIVHVVLANVLLLSDFKLTMRAQPRLGLLAQMDSKEIVHVMVFCLLDCFVKF